MTSRHNGLLTVANYGTHDVMVASVSHGMSVINDEVNTRHHRTTNFKRVTSGSFDLSLICTTYEEYAALNLWLMKYGEIISDIGSRVNPMRVTIPLFSFDKIGIPTTGVAFGDRAQTVVYEMTLSFVGTSDPVGPDAASRYVGARVKKGDEATAGFLYPGSQLKGTEMSEQTLYDQSQPALALFTVTTPPPEEYRSPPPSTGVGRGNTPTESR